MNFVPQGFQELSSDRHAYICTYIQRDRQTWTTLYHATSWVVSNVNKSLLNVAYVYFGEIRTHSTIVGSSNSTRYTKMTKLSQEATQGIQKKNFSMYYIPRQTEPS